MSKTFLPFCFLFIPFSPWRLTLHWELISTSWGFLFREVAVHYLTITNLQFKFLHPCKHLPIRWVLGIQVKWDSWSMQSIIRQCVVPGLKTWWLPDIQFILSGRSRAFCHQMCCQVWERASPFFFLFLALVTFYLSFLLMLANHY